MNLETIIGNKLVKPKAKTEAISNMLMNHKLAVSELIAFAGSSKDAAKATCIESLEFATKALPEIATPECLNFVSEALTEKAPRVKWESAKVIGNIAHLFPEKLDTAIKNLLINTEHSGTVVRWSAAFALGQILKLKSPRNKNLIPAIEAICKQEERNSIKKIYLAALAKT